MRNKAIILNIFKNHPCQGLPDRGEGERDGRMQGIQKFGSAILPGFQVGDTWTIAPWKQTSLLPSQLGVSLRTFLKG
ncbi:hypothetical protein BST81_09755 [Leptolyngbya sp. 'hensonii']|nr:hypothetical protein BST81_09755 [Leptolyngbya sp. 'hensonii']